MILEFTCTVCEEDNSFKPKFPNRGELQMKIGDEVNVNCKHCGTLETKHINKIRAVADYRIIWVGLALGIIITLFLWYYLGAIALVSGIVPVLVYAYEHKAVHTFNVYRIKRK